MKASVYIATSLDGFIARPNGELDWLPGIGSSDSGEDYGYAAFMASVDYLIMGRNTYELARRFDPWPYAGKPVVVLSSHGIDIPERIASSVESMCCSAQEVVCRMAARGASHLYVDGGRTIQGFLSAGLIQQLIITTVPVLIGRGVPLFGLLAEDIRLSHLETRTFANGLVQSRYERVG